MILLLLLSSIYVSSAFDYTNSVGLAPGLYCGLQTCYDGEILLNTCHAFGTFTIL